LGGSICDEHRNGVSKLEKMTYPGKFLNLLEVLLNNLGVVMLKVSIELCKSDRDQAQCQSQIVSTYSGYCKAPHDP
jgi:hypothetical protein